MTRPWKIKRAIAVKKVGEEIHETPDWRRRVAALMAQILAPGSMCRTPPITTSIDLSSQCSTAPLDWSRDLRGEHSEQRRAKEFVSR
jgi:hypothetical protein